jgi:Tol biopolymer transport system component
VDVSPDGTKIVYATDRLYIRPRAESTARPVTGTDRANGFISDPTFSPDGSSIVFWFGPDPTKGELKKVSVDGGPSQTVTPASYPFGITWSADGIVYAQVIPPSVTHLPSGILRVSPNGGTPQQLVAVKDNEAAIEPQILSAQNALLFTHLSELPPNNLTVTNWDHAQIVVQSLATGQRTVVAEGGAGRYVRTGHLLYALGGTLLATPFDANALRSIGPPVRMLEGVARPASANFAFGNALFSVSDTGTLIYIAGDTFAPPDRTIGLGLLDGKGEVQQLNLPPGSYELPRVSPDGKRVAYDTDDGTVWTYDLSGATSPLRITFTGRNRNPVWTPDGQRLAFQSIGTTRNGIFWQRADGSGTAERLTAPSPVAQVPQAWSPKGDVLLFAALGPHTTFQILTLADGKIVPLGGVEGLAGFPVAARFSPDGRWIAYSVAEDTAPRVYVQPFPTTGAKYLIAVNATDPVWSRDGRELFYRVTSQQGPRLARVTVTTQPAFAFTNPTSIELKRDVLGGDYDVLPNGRFIYRASAADRPAPAPANPPIHVVLNWFEELKQRAPVK